jgi:hypothetical protein
MVTLAAPESGEDVRPERIVLGLRISFRRDEFAELTEIYELTIDGEPFTVDVSAGTVDTRPGTASSPAMRLRTDAGTFVALLTGELAPAVALADDRAALEGERETLERFIEAFGFAHAA